MHQPMVDSLEIQWHLVSVPKGAKFIINTTVKITVTQTYTSQFFKIILEENSTKNRFDRKLSTVFSILYSRKEIT